MAEEYFKGEQAKIAALEGDAAKTEKTKSLSAKLSEHHATFFNTVDEARKQLNGAEEKLSAQNSERSLLLMDKSDINSLLRTAAIKGREIFIKENQQQKVGGQEYQTLDQSASKLKQHTKSLQDNVPFFIGIDKVRNLYAEKAEPALKKAEDIQKKDGFKSLDLLPSTDIAINELAEAKKNLLILQDSTALASYRDIYEETLKPINDKLEEMGEIKLYYDTKAFCEKEGTQEIDKVVDQVGVGQYGATHEMAHVKSVICYFKFDEKTGKVTKTAEFEKLTPERQQEIIIKLQLLRKKVADGIDEKVVSEEYEKKFFEGKKKLADGDWIGAKNDLLAFWNKESKKEGHNETKVTETEVLLRNIAKMELAQARGRLNLISQTVKTQIANASLVNPGQHDFGTTGAEAERVIDNMSRILDEAEKMVESGKALTINDAENALRKIEIKQTDPNPNNEALQKFQQGALLLVGDTTGLHNMANFNVLAQQRLLTEQDPQKRQENIKKMAEQARKEGLTDLAKHYYDMYFQEEAKEKAKTISRGEIEYRLGNNPKIQKEITERYESWKSSFKEQYYQEYKQKFLREHPNDEPKTPNEIEPEAEKAYQEEKPRARGKIFNSMVNEAYNKAIKKAVHFDFKNQTTEKAQVWKDTYDNKLLNLENIEGDEGLFADAEWDKFKISVFLDIALIIASAGLGAAAAELLVGTALRAALTEAAGTAAVQAAMRQGTRQFAAFVIEQLGTAKAFQYGIANLAVDSFVFNAAQGGLNALAKNDASTFANPEAFFKSWGHTALLLGACKVGNLGYSFRTPPKGVVSIVAREIGQIGVDTTLTTAATAGLQALSGQDITRQDLINMTRDNIIFSVGMKGAHILMGGNGADGVADGEPDISKERTKEGKDSTSEGKSKQIHDVQDAAKADSNLAISDDSSAKTSVEKAQPPEGPDHSNNAKHDLEAPNVVLSLPKDNSYPFSGPKARYTALSNMLKAFLAEKGIKAIESGKKVFTELPSNDPRLTPEMQNMGKVGKVGLIIMPKEATSSGKNYTLDVFFVVEIDGQFHRINKANKWNQKPLSEVQAEVNEIYIPSEVRDIGNQRYVLTPIIDNIEHPSTITKAEYDDFMGRLKKSKISVVDDSGSSPGEEDVNMVRYKGKLYLCDGGDVIGAPMGEKIPDATVAAIASDLKPRIAP